MEHGAAPGRRWGWGWGRGCSLVFIVILAVVILYVWFRGGNETETGTGAETGTETAEAGTDTGTGIGTETETEAETGAGTGTADRGATDSAARQKLSSGLSYNSDCVEDGLGWIEDEEDEEALQEGLEYFFDATGVQPYLVLEEYIAGLSEDGMIAYAEDWYEKNIEDEYTFLYFCFAGEDAEEAGYMCYVAGSEASGVMDEEAVEIFWDYIDFYWESDLETGEMFAWVFMDTADVIMYQH